MSVPDPYKVLQVDSEAEFEVIEAAYRRLARKYHPDISPDPESQERMVRINQAWELLRDATKRAAVDRARLRNAGSAARIAAADADLRAATTRTATSAPAYAAQPAAVPRPGPQPQQVSTEWTSGRSNAGAGYDPFTMGAPQGVGTAGPPPGKPSGSVLNFGRYAGWSLGEISRSDIEYIEWLDRMPIGRTYQAELDELLRINGRRISTSSASEQARGLFRRR